MATHLFQQFLHFCLRRRIACAQRQPTVKTKIRTVVEIRHQAPEFLFVEESVVISIVFLHFLVDERLRCNVNDSSKSVTSLDLCLEAPSHGRHAKCIS